MKTPAIAEAMTSAPNSAKFIETPERLQSTISAITDRCRANFKPQNIPADLKAIKGWVVWVAKEKAKPQPGKFDIREAPHGTTAHEADCF